jgi:TRAP-type C4-dicarboxylate transport system permease small subunit
VVLTALIATANVIVQKLFHGNISSANDYVTYMFVVIVYAAIPHVQMETDLTNVDILSVHFPKKVNLVISIIGDVIGMGIFGFIGYAVYRNVFVKYFTLKTVATIGASGTFVLWPFALLAAVSMMLMVFTFVWNNVRRVVYHGEKYIPVELCQAIGMKPPHRFGPQQAEETEEKEGAKHE